MARRQTALAGLSIAAAALVSLAQEARPPVDPLAPATPSGAKPERDGERGRDKGKDKDKDKGPDKDRDEDRDHKRRGVFSGPDADKAREAYRNMSPEERERWTKRFREWAEMPPEKKKSLADREEYFRRKIREDIDAAIVKAGLQLDEEQKKLFSERYLDERRKIESELRKEMDEKRGPRVDAMIERLKSEFRDPVGVKAGASDKR
jgi:hypothetical protein